MSECGGEQWAIRYGGFYIWSAIRLAVLSLTKTVSGLQISPEESVKRQALACIRAGNVVTSAGEYDSEDLEVRGAWC